MYGYGRIDLEALRKAANISQADMAVRLGVSQSQVSRYEQNPDEVPLGIIKKWVEICGDISRREGLDVGEPYREILKQIELIENYADVAAPPIIDTPIIKDPPTVDAFLSQVRRLGRKPKIAICGCFDAGKTRLLNTLMGGDRLPAAYQPATSVICLIRHINQRPDWQKEDVWMMGLGFDFSLANDKQHCEQHRVIAGGYDTLKRYGTHQHDGASNSEKCWAALVYVDSSFLLGCDLIDLPGYGDLEADQKKAEFAQRLADILIYTSPAIGFLGQNDFTYINTLMKQLPVFESVQNGLPALRNIYFVATRASMEETEGILDIASKRAFKHLQEGLDLRNGKDGVKITQEGFRKRFFPFLVEDPILRQPFETDVLELLTQINPYLVAGELDRAITGLKTSCKGFCDTWVAWLTTALEDRTRARDTHRKLESAEPERKRRVAQKKERVLGIITQNKEATRKYITEELSAAITADAIERTIRERYDDKKEAQELAGSYVTDSIQNKISAFLSSRAEKLVPEIDDLLLEFEEAAQVLDVAKMGETSIPFNAKGVFLGGLAAAGTAGALTAWASIAAAGSNLGAYLLVPSVVSFLSSVGISIAGGTAGAVSFVAALGGPITILIGLTVLAGLLGYALFGSSWQNRLAKKIAETIKGKKVLDTLVQHSNKYWSDTERGLVMALGETERAFQENLDNFSALAESTSPEEITRLRKIVQANRDFFAGIPWRGGTRVWGPQYSFTMP